VEAFRFRTKKGYMPWIGLHEHQRPEPEAMGGRKRTDKEKEEEDIYI
jgi:hypothetical protein